ncbi:MAG: insulinase family protein [Deferribacteraceae bacterium]|jgi:predicted Zn-dependent peptidase|nr:insulinase family protein [Deferribacteraceae bacterium]
MKRILICILLLGVVMTDAVLAQDRELFENGVRWKSISRDYTQTVSLVVFVKGGLFRETVKNNGVGALFARTWLKSGKLMEKVEFVGGMLNAGLSGDYFEFSIAVASDNLDFVLPELTEQILSPQFSQTVFEREKDITLREIEAAKDDPSSIAYQLFMEATYKKHPYSMKAEGTAKNVSSMTLKDIRAYYDKHFYASDMIVVLAGKYTETQMKRIQNIFRTVPKGKPLKIDCSGAGIVKNERIEATDPRIQQAKLYLSYSAPSADSKEYVYSKILSDLLGGGMSSPYFTALRKEKGYAYSVNVIYPSRLCASRLTGYAGLQIENADDAVATMRKINSSIADILTDGDLEKSKNHIIGQVLSEAETNNRRAWYAAFFENLGLGFDHMDRYISMLKAVKKENISEAAGIFKKPYTIFILKPEE